MIRIKHFSSQKNDVFFQVTDQIKDSKSTVVNAGMSVFELKIT